jgi:hypothetical protein
MKTNSDRRNTSKRCQSTYQIKTRLRNGGRIAGMGILHDDYSEESYGGYRNSNAGRVRTVSDFLTPEERVELNGPVKIYRIKDELALSQKEGQTQ